MARFDAASSAGWIKGRVGSGCIRRGGSAAGLLLALTVALSGCTAEAITPPAASADIAASSTAQTTTDPFALVCQRADELTRQGRPDEALAVIQAARTGIAVPTTVCEAERLRAVHGAAQDTPTTWAQKAQERMEAAVESYGTPSATVLLAVLGGIVALLVLARVLMLLPGLASAGQRAPKQNARASVRRPSPWLVGIAGTVGSLLIVVCGVGCGSLLAFRDTLEFNGWWGAVPAGLILFAVAGPLLLAWSAANALRLDISASTGDAESNAAAGHVVALLKELGGNPARGVEIPRGTDVEVLNSVGITTTPSNSVVALIAQVAELLVPRSPWRVSIEGEGKGDDILSMAVTRNRRYVDSAVIDKRDVVRRLREGLSDAERGDESVKSALDALDLHYFAAAFVLMTMSRYYTRFDGLFGATQWRSVGFYALATTERLQGTALERPLLVEAVSADAGNLAAQVARQRCTFRKSESKVEWATFAHRLDGRYDDLRRDCYVTKPAQGRADPRFGLLIRVAFLRAVAHINHASYPTQTGSVTAPNDLTGRLTERQPARATEDLLVLLRTTETPLESTDERSYASGFSASIAKGAPIKGEESYLDEDMKPRAAAMFANTHHPTGQWDAAFRWSREQLFREQTPPGAGVPTPKDLAPKTAYTMACFLATAPQKEEAYDEVAVELLRDVRLVPEIRQWCMRDPQLREFREANTKWRDTYLRAPASDVMAVEPFATHQKVLASAGIRKSCELADVDVAWLASLLRVRQAVAQNLIRHAELAQNIKDNVRRIPLKPGQDREPDWDVDLFRELVAIGYWSWPVSPSDADVEKVALALSDTIIVKKSAADVRAALALA